jgi:hypothetical protein
LQFAHETPMKHWVDPKQQPPLQLVVVHWQVALVPVPTQVVPVGQGPPVEPQTQAPLLGSHRFAAPPTVQSTQALPFAPQALFDGVVQVEPLQQPPGQRTALQPEHCPPLQLPVEPHD